MPACIDCRNFTKDENCGITGLPIGLNFATNPNVLPCSKYIMSTPLFIENIIQTEVCSTKGSNCWLSRKYIIREKLEKLNPDVPKDNSVGKIAFDVPDKSRMKIRTQRFLTRKLNLNNGFLPDHIISNIANKINSTLFPDIKIELIKGKAITECYSKSVGSGSCMTGSCANFTKLYEMNPDKIQMLTMYYMNDSARAILYKLDNDKGYYLDRVYASCKLLEDKMYAHADNNNWISYDNLPGKTYEEKDSLVISDLMYEDGYVPYMDTFEGTIFEHRLTLSRGGDICLDSTSGYIDGTGYTCEWCDEHIHEDDAVSVGDYTYCQYCVDNNFTFCERCNEYTNNNNAVKIEDKDMYVCQRCADNYYTVCQDCGEYNSEEYTIIEDAAVCDGCTESDKYVSCETCGEWFYEENTEDGYCEDCKPEDEEDYSTHADDPRPYTSCKTEDTKKLPLEEN